MHRVRRSLAEGKRCDIAITYVKWAAWSSWMKSHLVLINFTICPANARERERYDSAADKIGSIRSEIEK